MFDHQPICNTVALTVQMPDLKVRVEGVKLFIVFHKTKAQMVHQNPFFNPKDYTAESN